MCHEALSPACYPRAALGGSAFARDTAPHDRGAGRFQVLDFGLSPTPPPVSPARLGPVTCLGGLSCPAR
jgi:hypothetical protein